MEFTIEENAQMFNAMASRLVYCIENRDKAKENMVKYWQEEVDICISVIDKLK